MFTLEQIHQAHSQMQSGADFPKYIQALKTLGVISYEVSVRDASVIYSGLDNFLLKTTTGLDPLSIMTTPDPEIFISDLKNHQNGNTDYPTFCRDCAKSGIEKWRVLIDALTCTYFDISGNAVLVETIPG
jgi:uncharacterized protein YbcV (DUF1398 family)